MISKWKSEFLENMSSVFEKDNSKKNEENIDVEVLYAQIGQLKIEKDFLKKKLQEIGNINQRMELVSHRKHISVRRQCDLFSQF